MRGDGYIIITFEYQKGTSDFYYFIKVPLNILWKKATDDIYDIIQKLD